MHARIEGARSRRSCKNVERTKFYFQLEHAYWKVEARRLERRGQSHFLAFFRSRGRLARRLRAFIQGRKTSRCLENAPTGRPPPPSLPLFSVFFIQIHSLSRHECILPHHCLSQAGTKVGMVYLLPLK